LNKQVLSNCDHFNPKTHLCLVALLLVALFSAAALTAEAQNCPTLAETLASKLPSTFWLHRSIAVRASAGNHRRRC